MKSQFSNALPCFALVLGAVASSSTTHADDNTAVTRADSHAPIGVMGDHRHKQGEWMLSYRYMYMDMQGNRDGSDRIDADTIATTVPNRFFGRPMQPPTLRVVPGEMRMDMHMFGAMFAPSDWLTVMLMTAWVEKEMDHTTYAGAAGTAVRGTFTTRSDGIADTRVSSLVKLYDGHAQHVHANVGVSLPTGSTTERDRILTPMGMTPEVRLPYAMQIGSGTVDLLPGVTWSAHHHEFGWGAQYAGTVRTGHEHGYRLGDQHELTGWLSYQVVPALSTSMRIRYTTLGQIDGSDAAISGPVQTADPDNYGGDTVELLFGINLAGQSGWMHGKRLAVEVAVPLARDLNGPQMETDLTLTAGLQIAF